MRRNVSNSKDDRTPEKLFLTSRAGSSARKEYTGVMYGLKSPRTLTKHRSSRDIVTAYRPRGATALIGAPREKEPMTCPTVLQTETTNDRAISRLTSATDQMNKLKPNVSPGQAYKSSRAHTNMLLSQQPKPANQANSSQLRITNVTIVPRKRNQPQQMKKQRSVPALLQQSHFLNRCSSNTNLGNDKKQAPKKQLIYS